MLRIRIRVDPHHPGKLDQDLHLDPYQSEKLVPDPQQSEKRDPGLDLHKSERRKPYRVILEHLKVQIWKKVSGRNRISIKLTGRIRIRIRVKVGSGSASK